jgi:hypothetical protein
MRLLDVTDAAADADPETVDPEHSIEHSVSARYWSGSIDPAHSGRRALLLEMDRSGAPVELDQRHASR